MLRVAMKDTTSPSSVQPTTGRMSTRQRWRRWMMGSAIAADAVVRVLLASAVFFSPAIMPALSGVTTQAMHPVWAFFCCFGALAAVWLLIRLPSWLLLVCSVPSLIYSGYILKQGRELNRNDIVVVINTTYREIIDFLSGPQMIRPVLLTALVLAVLIVLAGLRWTVLARLCAICRLPRVGQWFHRWTERTIPLYRPVLLVLACGLVGLLLLQVPTWNFYHHYPVKTGRFIQETIDRVIAIEYQYQSMDYRYAGPSGDELPAELTLMFAICESARASNWQAYG